MCVSFCCIFMNKLVMKGWLYEEWMVSILPRTYWV